MITPARKPLDCDHQSVCWMFRYDKKQQEGMLEFCFRKYCIHDSRSAHTSPPAPERDFVNTPEKPWCYPGCMLVSNAKTEAARQAREESETTDNILAVLRKRYRAEMAILDYIEMIECEVIALRAQQEQPK